MYIVGLRLCWTTGATGRAAAYSATCSATSWTCSWTCSSASPASGGITVSSGGDFISTGGEDVSFFDAISLSGGVKKCQGVQTKTDLRSTYPLQICPPNRLFNFVVDLLKQGNARMKKHPPKYYCSSDLVLVAVTGLFDVPGKNSSFSYPLCINLVVIVIVYSGCCRHILPFIWAIKLQPTFEQLIQWQQ